MGSFGARGTPGAWHTTCHSTYMEPNRITSAVQRRGWTIEHLARTSLVSRSTLYRMMAGRPTTDANRELVARALGVTPTELFN